MLINLPCQMIWKVILHYVLMVKVIHLKFMLTMTKIMFWRQFYRFLALEVWVMLYPVCHHLTFQGDPYQNRVHRLTSRVFIVGFRLHLQKIVEVLYLNC